MLRNAYSIDLWLVSPSLPSWPAVFAAIWSFLPPVGHAQQLPKHFLHEAG
jgi:hypothetical protein